ncbi:type III secretion apparatus assembly chaperone SctY [Roseiconus lacunae]|uniref:type III secretion apparatus assembly chaperone SctY n=1 Tax=Roseiconus lacunae TaxID=2605694 RepID=UPI001E2CDBE6|nr:tetratricopeptide repeat protein [Roseiconus lacunae]MCD0457865.1 tetratricopeptide repeat protein [Roseiconus lacunae]
MNRKQRDFLVLVSYVYLQHGDAADARALLESVLVCYPQDRDASKLLAYACLQLNDFERAYELTVFLLGGPTDRQPENLWLMHSRALLGLDKKLEAIQLWHSKRNLNRTNHVSA